METWQIVVLGFLLFMGFMYYRQWDKIKAIHENSKQTAKAWVDYNIRRRLK